MKVRTASPIARVVSSTQVVFTTEYSVYDSEDAKYSGVCIVLNMLRTAVLMPQFFLGRRGAC